LYYSALQHCGNDRKAKSAKLQTKSAAGFAATVGFRVIKFRLALHFHAPVAP